MFLPTCPSTARHHTVAHLPRLLSRLHTSSSARSINILHNAVGPLNATKTKMMLGGVRRSGGGGWGGVGCPPRRAFSFAWTIQTPGTREGGGGAVHARGRGQSYRGLTNDSKDSHPRAASTPPPSPTSSSSESVTSPTPAPTPPSSSPIKLKELRENIYTIPNLLTVSRILACPVLGWSILEGDFYLATGLLAYAGVSDWVDGFLARKYKMQSVLGTILDPAADKTLMTTLVVTTCMKGLLPLPLLVVILGRDVLLSLSAFWIRYTSLPSPKTFKRYWDFSIPSAEVRPTTISKVNTALQLALMGVTVVGPILPFNLATPFAEIAVLNGVIPIDVLSPLSTFQWIVATTTVWSGLSYIFSKNAVRIVAQGGRKV